MNSLLPQSLELPFLSSCPSRYLMTLVSLSKALLIFTGLTNSGTHLVLFSRKPRVGICRFSLLTGSLIYNHGWTPYANQLQRPQVSCSWYCIFHWWWSHQDTEALWRPEAATSQTRCTSLSHSPAFILISNCIYRIHLTGYMTERCEWLHWLVP